MDSEGTMSWRERQGKTCVRGAWLGMGAALALDKGMAQVASTNPNATVPAAVAQAAALIEALASAPPVDGPRLAHTIRETLACFPDAAIEDGQLPAGLLPALVVTLWIRSRDPWRVLTAASAAMGAFKLSRFQQLGAICLCLWVRGQHAARSADDSWRAVAPDTAALLAESDLEPEYTSFPLRALDPQNGGAEDSHRHLIRAMLDFSGAEHLAAAVAKAREILPHSAEAPAVAGFMHGYFNGVDALPADAVNAALSIPWICTGAEELKRKHGSHPILRNRPVITSRSLPLGVADVSLGRTRMLLSATPGTRGMTGSLGGGPAYEDRDLKADLAVLTAAGAQAVVCLLEADEILDFGLDDLGASATAAGLAFRWCAMPQDVELPLDSDEIDRVVADLRELRDAGASFAIHAAGAEPRLSAGASAIMRLMEPEADPAEIDALVEEAIGNLHDEVDYDALV